MKFQSKTSKSLEPTLFEKWYAYMNRVNTFSFVTIGKDLSLLSALKEHDKYHSVAFKLSSSRTNIEELIKGDFVTIRICKQAAQQLIQAISDVVPTELHKIFQVPDDREISWLEAYRIAEAAKRFETVLAEELNVLDTYSIAQKGAYSTTDLINNAEIMFPASIRAQLPQQVVVDFREAGRCLAFESPTASAFHVLRALEVVLIKYYEKFSGKPVPARMRNWGVYINNMRSSGTCDPKIIELMQHIKDHYRNPVSHPEVVMTTDELIVLVGTVVSATTQMITAIAKIGA